MHGDRRPFPVMLITLDEEEIVPWAQQQGIEDTSIAALAQDPEVHALIQGELDEANAKYAQVEQVKKFVILDHDLSQETGELTPTLKVKRNVVNEKYADRFDALYAAEPPAAVGGGAPPLGCRACAPTRPTTAASSSAAGPARRRCATAALPERGQRERGGGSTGSLARGHPRAHGPRQPALLGPAPRRRGCGSPARMQYCDRQPRPGPARRLRRAHGRRCSAACASSSGWTRRGSSCAARRASTSARASCGASSPATAVVGAVAFIVLADLHRRASGASRSRPADVVGLLDYYKQFEALSRGGGQRRACARRPTSAAQRALARVEPLDLSRTTWPEYPPPADRQRDHLRGAPRAAPLPRPRRDASCAAELAAPPRRADASASSSATAPRSC